MPEVLTPIKICNLRWNYFFWKSKDIFGKLFFVKEKVWTDEFTSTELFEAFSQFKTKYWSVVLRVKYLMKGYFCGTYLASELKFVLKTFLFYLHANQDKTND